MNEDTYKQPYPDVDVRRVIRHFLGEASKLGVALPHSTLYSLCRGRLPGLVVGEYNKALNGLADADYLGYHKGVILSGMTLKSAWDGDGKIDM